MQLPRLGGDGVAEVPAEIGRGSQIDRSAHQGLPFELDGGNAHQAGNPIGLELDEEVDVTVGAEVVAER